MPIEKCDLEDFDCTVLDFKLSDFTTYPELFWEINVPDATRTNSVFEY